MAVVNDRAERHIRLVQDFIGTSHDEERFQDNLQVIHQNRKDISKNASKSDFKENKYTKIIFLMLLISIFSIKTVQCWL